MRTLNSLFDSFNLFYTFKEVYYYNISYVKYFILSCLIFFYDKYVSKNLFETKLIFSKHFFYRKRKMYFI